MQRSWETPEPIELDVSVPSGRVRIEASETATTELRLEGPAEVVDRAAVELADGRLRVDVPRRKGLSWGFDDRVELRVRCPEGSGLGVRTRSAAVTAVGRLAAARVGTASGDVSLDRVESGDVESASGEVRVTYADGDVAARTASGDVTVGRAGSLVANVVSGDLDAGEIAGDVTATSVSGDVRIDSVAEGRVKVEAVSGDVRVGVRRGTRVSVDATTLSGHTRSELDLHDEPPAGGDGPRLDLRIQTVSGDVDVVRAPALATQEA